MRELLGHDDHFPCCAEDRLVTLLLPEFNVEFPVRKSISNYSCFPTAALDLFPWTSPSALFGLPRRPKTLFLYTIFAGLSSRTSLNTTCIRAARRIPGRKRGRQ